MKKITSTVLIISTIFSITAGIFLYKPKEAQAILGIGDISIDPVQFIKEQILDNLVKPIAKHMMVRLQQEIGRWAQGGFTDQNKPFAMTSWKEEVAGALQVASSKFVSKYNLTPLCTPFKIALGTTLGIGLPYGSTPYEVYGACTLGDIVDNVEDFWKNPSISVYGWDSWTALTQPNNNVLGSFLMAQGERTRLEEEEITEQEKEIEANQGIKNDTICTKTDQEDCVANCNQYPATINGMPNTLYVACVNSCEKSSIGVCIEEQIRTMGKEIDKSIDSAIGSEMDWLLSADEITEMLGLVFSGLFNKLTHGINGLLTKGSSSTTTTSQNEANYGYYQDYKKTITSQDIAQTRTDIITNISKSIKNVVNAGYTCDKDEQLKGEVYQEVATDILNEESQHLYTATEGVDLKPDFIVLDNAQAVQEGYAIYGQTWDDIPFSKYPDKCSAIANKQCKNVLTGLPYELKLENINNECTTGCLGKINEYRVQEISDNESITKAVADGKCSSFTIGNQCLQGAHLINNTQNKCDACISKANSICEIMNDKTEKENCIKTYCGDYKTISSNITSAQDFYNRCGLLSLKNSCNTCLKEYFMPAYYCGVIYDFINRAFVKYPALVYHDTWWGNSTVFYDNPSCLEHKSTEARYIPTGLTCRISPDFKFPGGGTCKTLCNVTDEELKNLGDDQPADLDCKGPLTDYQNPTWGGVWNAGAFHPGGQLLRFYAIKKAQCCGGLVGNNDNLYQICRGTIGNTVETPVCTYGKPVDQEPWCYCDEGDKPLGFTRTGLPRTSGLGGDCSDISFESPGQMVYGYTNAVPVSGDNYYFSKNSCTETENLWENTTGRGITDGATADPEHCCSTDAKAPSNIINSCTWTGKGTVSNPFACDLTNVTGTVHAGVYHTGNGTLGAETSTGWHICTACDPSDPGYPNYGTEFDQCNNKVR